MHSTFLRILKDVVGGILESKEPLKLIAFF